MHTKQPIKPKLSLLQCQMTKLEEENIEGPKY